MIVRDEVAVIERCLVSVKSFIDCWVIVDTGSTDGTQDLIRRFMADLPGELHERPWINFGHNRTEALELAKSKADYILIMDADNIFCTPPGWFWPVLSADAYELTLLSSGVRYQQCLLVADHLRWRWVGVLHEYLTTDAVHKTVALPGPWVDRRHEGARSRDPLTYRKDAAILEAALLVEPSNERYVFYLAQSWRDAGEPEKALAAYRRRVAMGGWDEEVWYASYEVAIQIERLGGSPAEVRNAYLDAYQRRPTRAEPLYQLARYHRLRNEMVLAYLFAKQAVAIPRPDDRLFLDESVYTWCSLDELATAAYWVGAFEVGRQALVRLLAEGYVPASHQARIEANLGYYPQVTATVPRTNLRASYSICIMTFPGYLHSRAFEDVALALQEGFAELGEVVPIVHDPKDIVGRGVILGANLVAMTPGLVIPFDAVIFNLEQVSDSSGWFGDAYLSLLRSHEVWDYSELNVAALRLRGVERVRQCGIGYAPCLTRIAPAIEEDIDVLFYGAIDGRRIPILQAVEATGLRVHRLFGVYGAERDTWISRSKVVLNIHAHPEQVFAIVRLSLLLANRRFVISEIGRNSEKVETALNGGLVFGTAQELPELCQQYVADVNARRAIADRGFDLFSSIRQADLLRTVLV